MDKKQISLLMSAHKAANEAYCLINDLIETMSDEEAIPALVSAGFKIAVVKRVYKRKGITLTAAKEIVDTFWTEEDKELTINSLMMLLSDKLHITT